MRTVTTAAALIATLALAACGGADDEAPDGPAGAGFPVTIATGLIFMVCVLIFRRGIVGEIYARWLGRATKGS